MQERDNNFTEIERENHTGTPEFTFGAIFSWRARPAFLGCPPDLRTQAAAPGKDGYNLNRAGARRAMAAPSTARSGCVRSTAGAPFFGPICCMSLAALAGRRQKKTGRDQKINDF